MTRRKQLTIQWSGSCSVVALMAASLLSNTPGYAADITTQTASQAVIPMLVAAASQSPDDPNIEVVLITQSRGRAADIAPVKSSLDAFQPQAVITRSFIEDSVADTSDYSGVVLISPSLSSGVNENGPGLSEKDVVIRGFGDGEYNVTYDGIPFADTNDPTHHTTAYFPASTIGAAQVDRGPGGAGNLGQATFGGTINLFSRTLSEAPYAQQKATAGSWNTYNFVTTLQSGDIVSMGKTRVTANFQELYSDGYLTFSKTHEYNQFIKTQTPLAPGVTLTLLATHNKGKINQADNSGATLAQVAKYGKNFALSNDPTAPTYYKYNTVEKETDMMYARLEAMFGNGFSADNTGYTYSYINQTLSATNVTQNQTELAAGKFPGQGTKAAPAGNLDVAGYDKLNSYRVWGNILRLTKTIPFGEVRGGLWYEISQTDRHRYDLDRTLGLPNPIEKAPVSGPIPPANIQFQERSHWTQYQPFLDVELQPFEGLTITPGVKYLNFERRISSPVESKTRFVNSTSSATFTKTLFFANANYRIADNWATYAQYAEGFLVPPLKIFYVPSPETHPTLKPQLSTNYQAGTVYNIDNFTFDADVYLIDFTNKFSVVGPSSDPFYTNLPGKTVYKGVEAQGTYAFDNGLAVFVNGSINSARDVNHKQVHGAPQWTAAAGLIYKNDGISVSLLNKFIGRQWGADGEPTAYEIASYSTTNLILGYDFGRFKIEAGIYNLFDKKNITDLTVVDGPKPNPLDSHDQYFFQPERNFQVTLRATLD